MGLNFDFSRQPDWPWLKASYPGNILLHVDCPFMEVVRRVGGRMAYLATPYTKAVLNDEGEALRFAAELEAYERDTQVDPEGVVDPGLLERLRAN